MVAGAKTVTDGTSRRIRGPSGRWPRRGMSRRTLFCAISRLAGSTGDNTLGGAQGSGTRPLSMLKDSIRLMSVNVRPVLRVLTAPILIAEDDEHDAELVRLALKKGGVTNPVQIVTNGAEVIAYLKAEPPFEDRTEHPFPRLLLLDIKMPYLNGFEVLKWIRSHQECAVVPIVMMSSSKLGSDVETAYRLGANAYLYKPATFANLVESITRLQMFWEICELPALPEKCR